MEIFMKASSSMENTKDWVQCFINHKIISTKENGRQASGMARENFCIKMAIRMMEIEKRDSQMASELKYLLKIKTNMKVNGNKEKDQAKVNFITVMEIFTRGNMSMETEAAMA